MALATLWADRYGNARKSVPARAHSLQASLCATAARNSSGWAGAVLARGYSSRIAVSIPYRSNQDPTSAASRTSKRWRPPSKLSFASAFVERTTRLDGRLSRVLTAVTQDPSRPGMCAETSMRAGRFSWPASFSTPAARTVRRSLNPQAS